MIRSPRVGGNRVDMLSDVLSGPSEDALSWLLAVASGVNIVTDSELSQHADSDAATADSIHAYAVCSEAANALATAVSDAVYAFLVATSDKHDADWTDDGEPSDCAARRCACFTASERWGICCDVKHGLLFGDDDRGIGGAV